MIIDKDGNHIDPETGVVVIATTTLGQVIRKKRLKWGFAQRDLAMMVRGERMPFCSPQTLNNIEQAFKAMESVLDKHLAERKKQGILPVSEESVVEKTQTSDD